jgi:hypothetical protein
MLLTKDMAMKRPALTACAAFLTLSTAGMAHGQTDLFACARTPDGAPILIGAEVRDARGERIGAVSLSQCTEAAEAGTLRVFLDESLGGKVKAFALDKATSDGSAVRLDVSVEPIAANPSPEAVAAAKARRGA